MFMSEIAEASAIVGVLTHRIDAAEEAGEDRIALRLYADEEAFLLAHPEAGPGDKALHDRILRATLRAAWRMGFEPELTRVRAAPLRAWLARQPAGGAAAEDYPGEPEDRFEGEAALRPLGLSAAELKEAPRKPAQGRTLAARIARWATDPDADAGAIDALAEELLAARMDGALGVAERMLEPEDFAHVRQEIDEVAGVVTLEEGGRRRDAVLFVSPLLRAGDAPCAPELPGGLRESLAGLALGPFFEELILAPFWIPTAAIARMKPRELREAAEALATGQEPPLPRAAPEDRDVCLLGLALPAMSGPEEEESEEAETARLDAWLKEIETAAGGGRAEPPVTLAQALDLLRRARLAVPLELPPPEEQEAELDEALLEALVAHVASIGEGAALLAGGEGGAVAFAIAGGVPGPDPEALRDALAEALLEGGVLFVAPAAGPGHAFVLEDGAADGLSAADAAAAFAEEAPQDWAARPATWADAPPLDYDPAA